jgi:hypothetical protein
LCNRVPAAAFEGAPAFDRVEHFRMGSHDGFHRDAPAVDLQPELAPAKTGV